MREVRQRAQVSVEYLLILSFIFAILIPGIFFFYSYSRSSLSSVSAAQFEKLGQEMTAVSLESAAQGTGSWLSLATNIPEGLVDIRVVGENETVFYYRTGAGVSEAVYFSDVRLCANATQASECPRDGSVFLGEPHFGRTNLRFTTVSKPTGELYVTVRETNN